MMNAEAFRDAEQRRLAWRCRRGLLELDIVLQRFVYEKFDQLTLEELTALDGLLDLPDNDFWTLIKSNEKHDNQALNDLLAKLNASSALELKDFS